MGAHPEVVGGHELTAEPGGQGHQAETHDVFPSVAQGQFEVQSEFQKIRRETEKLITEN